MMKYAFCFLLPLLDPRLQAVTPSESMANLPALRIGADDLISVHVYDAPELRKPRE
jgi:hypothetical protein